MKDLTIEQKAKRYDEALGKAEIWHNAPNVDKIPTFGNRIIEDIFPELREPEDEEVRNEIIKLVKYYYGATLGCKHTVSRDKMLAWIEKQDPKKHEEELEKAYKTADEVQYKRGYEDAVKDTEKQGEQVPAWGEEDESIALGIEQIVNCASLLNIAPDKLDKVRNWLKSIKDRVIPQPKQEWSEEDKAMLVSIISDFAAAHKSSIGQDKWLKSLKQRIGG